MNRFKQSRDKGCYYLLSQQHTDGFVGNHNQGIIAYYKTLMALQVCGETNAANRLAEWILKNGITDQGDFGPRIEPDNDSSYLYANAWTIIGAQRIGQFQLSQKGMDFLMRFYDSETGAFYSNGLEQTRNTQQDLMVVSFCGVAAIYTGRLDVAKAVGNWTKTLMERQPNFPNQLFTACSKANGLITKFDCDQAIHYLVNANANRDQAFFQPGVASGFLSLLYRATGEKQWLELAEEYMKFVEIANDFLFHIIRAGKVGWAASLLYRITGKDIYKETAARIGNNLITLQFPQGFWSTVDGNKPDIQSTAERVVWMDEIYQAVG